MVRRRHIVTRLLRRQVVRPVVRGLRSLGQLRNRFRGWAASVTRPPVVHNVRHAVLSRGGHPNYSQSHVLHRVMRRANARVQANALRLGMYPRVRRDLSRVNPSRSYRRFAENRVQSHYAQLAFPGM